MNLSAKGISVLSLIVGLQICPLSARAAGAKDLSGRFGVGASGISPGTGDVPNLSVVWEINQSQGAEFSLGTDTRSNQSYLMLGARYNRNLFIEENQFWFLYAGAGLVSQSTAGSSGSGFLLEAGGGTRYFFQGLPNLGVSLTAGLKLDSGNGSRFRTAVGLGFHYYF